MEIVARKLFNKNYATKIKIYTKSFVKKVKDEEVIVQTNESEISLGKFDDIVITAGTKPENELYEELKEEISKVYVIGDAMRVGQIMNAVQGALEVASKI